MPHWRELQQRLDMKSRAVDRDDAAVSPVKGKKQISAGEKDDLSACAMQLTARFEEEFPLRLGYRARSSHCDIFAIRALNDVGGRNSYDESVQAAEKLRGHYGSGAKESDGVDASLSQIGPDGLDGTADRQRRYLLKLLDAEVSGHRRDRHNVGTGSFQSTCQPAENLGLRHARVGCQIGQQLAEVGLNNGEVETTIPLVTRDGESTAIEFRCRRTNPANQADVHRAMLPAETR